MNMWKWMGIIFFSWMIVIVQMSSRNIFPGATSAINFSLVVAILLLMNTSKASLGVFTVLSGWILDLFSAAPFGILIGSFVGSILLARTLFLHFFTNQSLWSTIALTGGTTLLFRIFFFVSLSSIRFFNTDFPSIQFFEYSTIVLWELFLNVLCAVAGYWLFVWGSRRFRRIFLTKGIHPHA